MTPPRWKRSVTQVVWSDLDPWLDQLWKHHGVLVRVLTGTPAPSSRLRPVVRLVAYKPLPKGEEDVVADEYRIVDPRQQGSTEHAALQMVSALLLYLEREIALRPEQRSLFA